MLNARRFCKHNPQRPNFHPLLCCGGPFSHQRTPSLPGIPSFHAQSQNIPIVFAPSQFPPSFAASCPHHNHPPPQTFPPSPPSFFCLSRATTRFQQHPPFQSPFSPPPTHTHPPPHTPEMSLTLYEHSAMTNSNRLSSSFFCFSPPFSFVLLYKNSLLSSSHPSFSPSPSTPPPPLPSCLLSPHPHPFPPPSPPPQSPVLPSLPLSLSLTLPALPLFPFPSLSIFCNFYRGKSFKKKGGEITIGGRGRCVGVGGGGEGWCFGVG